LAQHIGGQMPKGTRGVTIELTYSNGGWRGSIKWREGKKEGHREKADPAAGQRIL